MKCLTGIAILLFLTSGCKKSSDQKTSDHLMFITSGRTSTTYLSDQIAYKNNAWGYFATDWLVGEGPDTLKIEFPSTAWNMPQYQFGIELKSKRNDQTQEFDVDLDADDWIQTEFYINGVLHDTQKGQTVEFRYPE